MNITDLKEKIRVFVENLGYRLYDLEFKKQRKGSILTVYLDKDEDINIDDCVSVTHELSPYLDEIDPIEGEYFLEVSSAGAEKELRTANDVSKSIGKYVYVETYEQKMEGFLESFDGNEVVLKIKNKAIKINYEDVNLIRLAIKF